MPPQKEANLSVKKDGEDEGENEENEKEEKNMEELKDDMVSVVSDKDNGMKKKAWLEMYTN